MASLQKSTVAFAIVFHNELNDLEKKLNELSLIQNHFDEVLICLNGCNEDFKKKFKEIFKTLFQKNDFLTQFRVSELTINNIAKARNSLLRVATSDWVYFTDPDCSTRSENLTCILQMQKQVGTSVDSTVKAIGGGLVYSSHAKKGLFDYCYEQLAQNWFAHLGSLQLSKPKSIKFYSLHPAANFCVERNAALSVNGFDEQFVHVGEDLSLCMRFKMKGYKILAVTHAHSCHKSPKSLIAWSKKMFLYGRAQIQIFAKYPIYFANIRGLAFISLIFLMLLSLHSVWLPCLFFASYLFFQFIFLTFNSKKLSPGVTQTTPFLLIFSVFIVLTHSAYAAGEVFELISLPANKVLNFLNNLKLRLVTVAK